MRLYAAALLAVAASVVAAALLTWHERAIDHHRQASSAAFVHQLAKLGVVPLTRSHLRGAAQRAARAAGAAERGLCVRRARASSPRGR